VQAQQLSSYASPILHSYKPFFLVALDSMVLKHDLQGRAALVALRRSGGGGGALGRSFYKGGFEPKMTRKEAGLILEMPYVLFLTPHPGTSYIRSMGCRMWKWTSYMVVAR
jgi:hypothetical protein